MNDNTESQPPQSSIPPSEYASTATTYGEATVSGDDLTTLVSMANRGDTDGLHDAIMTLGPADHAFALAHLGDDEEQKILSTLDASDAAAVLAHLNEAQAARIVAHLDADTAASIVHHMPNDVGADLIGDLPTQTAAEILEHLPPVEADAVRRLAAYDDNVAGGMMSDQWLSLSPDMTVGEAITAIGNHPDLLAIEVRYAYVCEDERLIGVLPLQDLMFVNRKRPINEIMISEPVSIADTTPLNNAAELFDRHAFLGIPVVDSEGRMIGVLNRDAVRYEELRAAKDDYLKSQGIVGGEELRTMPVRVRAGRRLSWLSLNIVLNLGAAAVIATFQDTLESVIALAVFLPIISDMSGCSGNQAVAVSMRELSLGVTRESEVWRVWMGELSVGLINGAALGALVGLIAYLYGGNVYLALVVGIALMINTVVAVSIGGLVPLLLKRLGFDPAVASGPLLTTVTDMCGFLLVLGFATAVLPQLI